MKAAIALMAALPPLLALSCWHWCECETICPIAGALACTTLALGAGLVIHVAGSIAWELHLLTR